MYKVLIPQDINSVGKNYLIDRGYEVIVGSGWDARTIKREVVDCDAIIARTASYSVDVISAGKKLQVIARYGVGTDNIDVKAAEDLGIIVTIAKNTNVQSVAEHAITLMLSCAKNIVYCNKETRNGNWEIRNNLPGTELHGKILGIVGLGAIGVATAVKAHNGFGMNILGYRFTDKSKLPDYIHRVSSIEEIFAQSDVVSLHIPLTPQTQNIVNKELISKMKQTSYLINCARGGIVNEDDLYEALKNNCIAGAAMDVFKQEPAPAYNKLFTLDSFLASPHNAGLTNESSEAMALSCARAVHDVLSCKNPQYPINNPQIRVIAQKSLDIKDKFYKN